MGNSNIFNSCICIRSLNETQMDDFWKNLEIRKLHPKSYLLKVKASLGKSDEEDLIKQLFTYKYAYDKRIKESYKSIYKINQTNKYFYISLLFLLNNKNELKNSLIELDNILNINFTDGERINNLIEFIIYHISLVSKNGIPIFIKKEETDTKLENIFKQEYIQTLVNTKFKSNITLDELIKKESCFLYNDSKIRNILIDMYIKNGNVNMYGFCI